MRLLDAQDAIIDHGETTISQLISCIEAARRGSFNFSRVHALLARKGLIELLHASSVAAEIEFCSRVQDGGAPRG